MKDDAQKKQFEKMCLCPACPSYVNCKELTFCLDGKSKCIKVEKGCICGGCPVHMKMNFKNFYYCIKGSEKVQEKTKK